MMPHAHAKLQLCSDVSRQTSRRCFAFHWVLYDHAPAPIDTILHRAGLKWHSSMGGKVTSARQPDVEQHAAPPAQEECMECGFQQRQKLLPEACVPCAGIPYALAGVVYVLVMSRWLLVGDQTRRHSDLLFVARIGAGSPAAGNTVRGAGLKRLDRLFLVAVQRQVGLLGSCSSSRGRMMACVARCAASRTVIAARKQG